MIKIFFYSLLFFYVPVYAVENNKIFFEFSQEEWNRIRREIEGEQIKEVIITTQPVKPLPPGVAVELPFESRLSISGRKLIGTRLSYTKYLKPDRLKGRVDRYDIDMNQELQVRIQGTIGERINVNVDFDDTRPDKRDVAITFRGRPGEVIQELSFGDITMSIPGTQFVSYSRELFGIKVSGAYKRVDFSAFGSRTKGQFETRRFYGNTGIEQKTISDTSYIRYKYFDIAFSSAFLPIVPESVKVYMDNRNPADDSNAKELTVDDYSLPSSSYTGKFDTLIPGEDYTVDYLRGILIFRKSIEKNYIIAVSYQRKDGIFLSQKIIKTENDLPIDFSKSDLESGWRRELKTYYFLGQTKIMRDNYLGNFILKVQDLNGVDRPDIFQYPQDIEVDFESGIFYIKTSTGFPQPEIYSPTPKSFYRFYVEYRYRIKTFFLRPGIVFYSEQIFVDNKKLTRDTDYFLDYESGFLTFFNEDIIKEDSVIEISYEYAPFGITAGETIAGLRSNISITPNWKLGFTTLTQFASQPETIPDVRRTPQKINIYEVDSAISNIRLWPFPIYAAMSGEFSRSEKNPNIFGKSMIESMEGIKEEDSPSMLKDGWEIASNPNKFSYDNEEILAREINPNIQTEERNIVMKVDYTSGEHSIIYPFSKLGVDFSKKLYIEAFIYGSGNNEELIFELGSFPEDVDGDGKLDTEDLPPLNGLLDINEDTGWEFNYLGEVYRIGEKNGKLDSEDLDADGQLDTIPVVTGVFRQTINWFGWKKVVFPLNITSKDEKFWQAIKQLRLTIRSTKDGQIKITNINVVGNRWEKPTLIGDGYVEIRAINNQDDPNYQPLFNLDIYKDIYGEALETRKTTKEQALAFKYQLSSGSYFSTKLTYRQNIDFSSHKKLRFLVYGDNKNANFFLRVGGSGSYYELNFPINWSGWRLISMRLDDKNNDTIPDDWSYEFEIQNSTTVIIGNPSFQRISEINFGLRNITQNSIGMSEIWVNDIYLTEANERVGQAYRYDGSFNIPGWVSFSVAERNIQRTFETLTSAIINRDQITRSYSASSNRIPFIPLSASYSTEKTITPQAIQTSPTGLVSILEEGKVESYTFQANAGLNIPKLPQFSGSYTLSESTNTQTFRHEKRDGFSLNGSYSLPFTFYILPANVSGSYSESKFLVDYSTKPIKLGQEPTIQISRGYNLRLPFNFFNILNLSTDYLFNKASERKQFVIERWEEFPKSLSESGGLSGNLRLIKWLSPNFSYRFTITENEKLTFTSTTVKREGIKNVDRQGSGSLSTGINLSDLFPRLKLVNSLNWQFNYGINDGDSYENVDSTFPVLNKIWIRKRLIDDEPTKLRRRLYFTKRDSINQSIRWQPFVAFIFTERLNPLKSFTFTANHTRSVEETERTGTFSKVISLRWPDWVTSISEIEKIFFPKKFEKYFSGSLLSLIYSKQLSETISQKRDLSNRAALDLRFKTFQKFDISTNLDASKSENFNLQQNLKTAESISLSGGLQVGIPAKVWRFTPRYSVNYSQSKDAQGKITSKIITHTADTQIYGDIFFPKGLRLPFIKKTISVPNRVIVTGNISLEHKSSPFDAVRNNTDRLNISGSVQYEPSPNFRFSVGLGSGFFYNRVKKDESFYNLEINGSLIIQF